MTTANAKISPIYFKDVTSCFKEGMSMYSPTYGAIMIESGLLSNLRLFGYYHEKFNDDGKRDYANDSTSDPHFNVIKMLFPSSAGQLTTESGADSNIGTLFKGENGIKAIATLLEFSHQQRQATRPKTPEEIEQIKNKAKVQKEASQKAKAQGRKEAGVEDLHGFKK
jgi:hypothetical protein